MSLNEFDIINHYFTNNEQPKDSSVIVGIGDDCAILDVPDGHQLAVSTDTLVSGIHFFSDVNPYRLGFKSLAVNLSDLAAMGATPKWVSLAITLPDLKEKWLAEFSRGFFALAKQFNIDLIGGDTTKGPLSITISVKGIVPRDRSLLRSGAKIGDLICVSGHLGDGGVGLASKLNRLQVNDTQYFVDALELTLPRIKLGIELRGLASSCIDISDGLAQDLQHIIKSSSCAAKLNIEELPLSFSLLKEVSNGVINKHQAIQYALTGGDDYELLFTINEDNLCQLKQRYYDPITVIGSIVNTDCSDKESLIQLCSDDPSISFLQNGWDHFQPGNN